MICRRYLLLLAFCCGLQPLAAQEPGGAEELMPAGGLDAEQGESPRIIAKFDDGFSVGTSDDQFELRIRVMEQTDFKLFLPTNQVPARPGGYIPRFRTYFEGHLSPSYEYELSLQRSIEGTFDVLDASLNFSPNDALQIKVGRFIVPYSYDWFDHLEQYFIAPERGLYPLNFGLSREVGAMLWGDIEQGRLQYAVGAFSGQLSGLADTNTTRDLVGYLNVQPFGNSGPMRYFNVGLSGAYGDQAFPAEPLPLRSSVQSSENDEAANAASSVFLVFDDDVEIIGRRNQGALHAAWYVGGMSTEAEVEVGKFGYEKSEVPTTVSVFGYHVTGSYFLTGEQVTGRSLVVPNRPFAPRSNQFGPGAIEPFVRYSYLKLGDEVFTAELADPNISTRSLSMIDTGVNWYPNRFIKLYLDWQLSLYDTPVLVVPETGKTVRQSHTLWARLQVFF
jgi:phosphate-selective porin OprO/OprP